ncbi:iron chelate uptake ABC transporter family permease subunit [Microbacterium lacticum]|uniref:FecCD family ABC transporter permease n=1 Tax=Microbacterium lacticum TaxID=33885 RepID=UPI0018B0CC03|nr:iron chelate uptake ABC transporter family permease subunit [Microbacterium lacticum]MBF9335021.1 iron chelate uptake ABC transporter family permease subunit [Microbacterium lacticum]
MAVPLVQGQKVDAAPEEGRLNSNGRRLVGVVALITLLVAVLMASLSFGANPIPVAEIWSVLFAPDRSEASSIVWTLRIPRTAVGIAAGVAFGIAGALIQAITRNPLADPGILGVNAGAGFAIVIGVALFGVGGITGYIWFSFIGAILATVLVYLIGSAGRGASSPVTLVLAGIALAAVLSAFSTFLTLMDQETFRSFRAWGLGSLSRVSLADTAVVIPFLTVGVLLAAVIGGSLNAVALGDDQATALGASVTRTRVLGIIAVTLLAGGGTALTGGIAFVGLMVPHVARWFTGPDQRWIIAYTALAAPSIVLIADVLGRVIVRPGEIEAGVLTALIGAPVLISLVRRRKASGL